MPAQRTVAFTRRQSVADIATLLVVALSFCHQIYSLPAAAADKAGTASGARRFHSIYSKENPLTRSALHDDRGLQLGRDGHWTAAIKKYEKALDDEPDNQSYRVHLSIAHLNYANVLASKKKLSKATDEYKECLYLDPHNKQADKRYDDCLRAKGKNPLDPALRLELARDADRDGHFDYALSEFGKSARLADDGISYFSFGKELLKLGKKEEARTALSTALDKKWRDNEQADKQECASLLGSISPKP
jgi:tetratricopeptide (TPR) repeat protein